MISILSTPLGKSRLHSPKDTSIKPRRSLFPTTPNNNNTTSNPTSTTKLASPVSAQHDHHSSSSSPTTTTSKMAIERAASASDINLDAPYFDPLIRSFILGIGTGALLEATHVAFQVLAGNFPGVSHFSPMIVADHVTAFASWICLYTIEAAAIMSIMRKFSYDPKIAANEVSNLSTLPRRMLPLRFQFFNNKNNKSSNNSAPVTAAANFKAIHRSGNSSTIEEEDQQVELVPPPSVVRAPDNSFNSVVPAPFATKQQRQLPTPTPTPTPPGKHRKEPSKRGKELRDRAGYLKNMWYAVALSEKVGKKEPVRVQLCGKEMVLFRSDDGSIHCIDNACPHRGAPLSEGWVEKRQGESCIVCPYHGWALSGQGQIRDVPAAENKGEWPKRPLTDAYTVVEKGGFIWLFYGSNKLRADERPPIPFVPELEDPTWKATYEEIEFEGPHFSVLENGIDFAHIFYLHDFGNKEKPEIKDLKVESDPFSVTGTFDLHNKPVNAFWALFQVPIVHVWAKAFLPSSSVVTFTLGGGLSFSTFVSTTPISKNRTINRFALVRKLNWDKTGIFNSRIWDRFAKDAMLKIQNEDKGMIEQLKYDQLPAEYSVRADLFQVAFRKLRQQWVDLGYLIPTEDEVPPHDTSYKDM